MCSRNLLSANDKLSNLTVSLFISVTKLLSISLGFLINAHRNKQTITMSLYLVLLKFLPMDKCFSEEFDSKAFKTSTN